MPPKRKQPVNKSSPAKRSKMKDQGTALIKDTLKKAASMTKKTHKVDDHCLRSFSHSSNAQVYQDYDCMLNQTNIGHNNNKFYIIQLIKKGIQFFVWNRWGRVGEVGQVKLSCPMSEALAIKMFEKKFKDKTKNKWSDRKQFRPFNGKYTLLEMGEEEEEKTTKKVKAIDKSDSGMAAPSTLDKATQSLVSLIFSTEMFKKSLERFNIDTNRMPLGKLSNSQIGKGFDVLQKIENIVGKKGSGNLSQLSSEFYTLIPHNFGRLIPPVINTAEKVREKKDMLLVLLDIELAQEMQKQKKSDAKVVRNIIDEQYDLLNCELKLLSHSSKEFKLIEQFTSNTKSRKIQILDAWTVTRGEEPERFKQHKNIDHRKLLWHGTDIAVVAAILKTGLRIMPHSGGLVGKGIYFASQNGTSACYVHCHNNIGFMFLAEVALGKEQSITQWQCNLKAAPPGFDSVVARGSREPNPKEDQFLTFDGKTVIVPAGKPKPVSEWRQSLFSSSEYLIYKESQCHLRFIVKCKF